MASVILKATNIAATIRWYEAAGFVLGGHVGEWCELARGSTTIQFLSGVTPWSGEPTLTGCVYVPVDDADQALAGLAAPVVAEWGVEVRDWGAREVVLRDPDGYYIALTEDAL